MFYSDLNSVLNSGEEFSMDHFVDAAKAVTPKRKKKSELQTEF